MDIKTGRGLQVMGHSLFPTGYNPGCVDCGPIAYFLQPTIPERPD